MFTSIGSLGTTNVKSLGTPITFSPDSNVAAGRIVVLWVAYDSVYNIAAPQNWLQQRWACFDDAGNIWVTLGAETDTGGFFATGPASILFMSQLRNGLATSDTITVDNQADGSLTAKALSAWEFSINSGFHWAATDRGPVVSRAAASDPGATGINDLVSQEYLFLHVLAVEGPDTDAYTWDGSWTEVDGDGTTGGADDTNVHVRGGFKIATSTAENFNITSDTADRDWCQVVVAICGVAATDFPTSSVLDNFNRADEDPLDNSTWFTDRTCGPSSPGSPRFMALSGNRANGGSTNAGGQQWDTEFFNCVEVFVDIPVLGSSSPDTGVDVFFHLDESSHNATLEGYGVAWRGPVFGNSLYWGLEGGTAGFQGGVGTPYFRAHVVPSAGSKLGAKRLEAPPSGLAVDAFFIDIGDGWEQVAAIYRNHPSAFRNVGYLGVAVWDPDTEVDNFGGGEVDCIQWMPEFIRRPWEYEGVPLA